MTQRERLALLASAYIKQNGPQTCDDARCHNYGRTVNDDGTCPPATES